MQSQANLKSKLTCKFIIPVSDIQIYCPEHTRTVTDFRRMPHLPGNSNLGTLTQPNEIDFMRTTDDIPGHTIHSVDYT